MKFNNILDMAKMGRALAFLVSAGAHIYLSVLFFSQPNQNTAKNTGLRGLPKFLNVQLAHEAATVPPPSLAVESAPSKQAKATVSPPRTAPESFSALRKESKHPWAMENVLHFPESDVGFLFPTKAYYFKTSELQERPKVLVDVSPDLVFSLSKSKPAILRLLINEFGLIDQVIIDEADLSEIEKVMVIDSFSKMKFEPGKFDGIPVKTEMKIELSVEKIIPIQGFSEK